MVIATPPAAICLWNSTSRSETIVSRVSPSNVAALMNRFRSVSGPRSGRGEGICGCR